MKTKDPWRRAALVLALLVLPFIAGSCASQADSGAGKSPAHALEAAPQNISIEETKSPLPPPTGFVNDYARVFDEKSKRQLEAVLTELKEKAKIEFAVVTVETTGEQTVFDYSLAVARGWGIGPKNSSEGGGLLLMMSVKDCEWRLQVSQSLRKDLPDEVARELGERSSELYRQGRYAEGLTRYVRAVIERLEQTRGFSLSRKL